MRFAWLLVACALALPVHAQTEAKSDDAKKEDTAKPAEKKAKPRARPRIGINKNGSDASVGRDAAGGGPHTAEPAQGGTPGTPSGSFTR